jgi:hypothetical protein
VLEDLENLRIVGVALRFRGITFSMPPPNRHHNLINSLYTLGVTKEVNQEQGFLLSNGHFCDRVVGAEVALHSGQCQSIISPPWLTSEDLW